MAHGLWLRAWKDAGSEGRLLSPPHRPQSMLKFARNPPPHGHDFLYLSKKFGYWDVVMRRLTRNAIILIYTRSWMHELTIHNFIDQLKDSGAWFVANGQESGVGLGPPHPATQHAQLRQNPPPENGDGMNA